MDSNRYKRAAEWFYRTVFQDEVIRPQGETDSEPVPPQIHAALSLEYDLNNIWRPREAVFVKQGKLLADYEDDYDYSKEVVRYYPTYVSFNVQELRAYFTWRTKLRRGEIQKTSLSYVYLYIYELLNQIGVTDPLDGFRKLKELRDAYSSLDQRILTYLDRWIQDYAVYYDLDPGLLADLPQVTLDRCVAVLEDIEHQEPAKVMDAVGRLSPKWLERSRFYRDYREDCDAVFVRVLRRVSAHYATRCKKSFVDQYFGEQELLPVVLFQGAVFYAAKRKRSRTYTLDEACVYHCERGVWTVKKRLLYEPGRKLGDLLKTIDSVMREEYNYPHPVMREMETKWLLKAVREETQGYLAEKKAAREQAEKSKITIDFSQLAKIRRDAAVTQDKLTVEEELEEPEAPTLESPPPEPPQAAPAGDCPLTPPEYRLVQCLLYGRDYGWVQAEGYILSVLLDSINDKLYDVFQDSVLDDTPSVVDDYLAELKEMVRP